MKKISLLNTIILYLSFLLITGCENKNEKLSWLSSDKDSAYVQIERQFRGMDVAMKEVGYRYNELYFAGVDENWDYAKYHLEKIKTTIDIGLERRPKRALSAKGFLEYSIPTLMKTIQSKNKESFLNEFEIFKQSCNACHLLEKVEFVNVVLPVPYMFMPSCCFLSALMKLYMPLMQHRRNSGPSGKKNLRTNQKKNNTETTYRN